MVAVIDHTSLVDKRVHGGQMADGDPSGIVLHHTGSTSEAGDEAWLSQYHPKPVSINQLIRRDGVIVQIVANNVVAYHAGPSAWLGRSDCNSWCMGVEICNDGVGEAYTDAQYETVAQTVAYNCAAYHILDEAVTSHARCALPHGRKDDPRGWDWARMWARIDALRAAWPFNIPLWVEQPARVMSTV